jgi:YD repeat-containing protein
VYDRLGRAAATVDPTGRRSSTAFDAAGRPAVWTDPLGARTTTAYDAAGRAVATVAALVHEGYLSGDVR